MSRGLTVGIVVLLLGSCVWLGLAFMSERGASRDRRGEAIALDNLRTVAAAEEAFRAREGVYASDLRTLVDANLLARFFVDADRVSFHRFSLSAPPAHDTFTAVADGVPGGSEGVSEKVRSFAIDPRGKLFVVPRGTSPAGGIPAGAPEAEPIAGR